MKLKIILCKFSEDKARSPQKHHHFQLFVVPVHKISDHFNNANNSNCSLLCVVHLLVLNYYYNIMKATHRSELRSSIGIEIGHTFDSLLSCWLFAVWAFNKISELFIIIIISHQPTGMCDVHCARCVHAKRNVPNAQLHI